MKYQRLPSPHYDTMKTLIVETLCRWDGDPRPEVQRVVKLIKREMRSRLGEGAGSFLFYLGMSGGPSLRRRNRDVRLRVSELTTRPMDGEFAKRLADRNGWRVETVAAKKRVVKFSFTDQSGTKLFDATAHRPVSKLKGYRIVAREKKMGEWNVKRIALHRDEKKASRN